MAWDRNRAQVKRRIRDIGKYAIDGWDSSYTWDFSQVSDNTFFPGLVTGANEPTSVGSGTQRSEDQFTVRCHLHTVGHLDAETAEEAVEDALRSFDAYLLAHPRLDGPAPGDVPLHIRCRVGEVDGPAHSFPEPVGGDSIEAWIDFTITCVTDLGGT